MPDSGRLAQGAVLDCGLVPGRSSSDDRGEFRKVLFAEDGSVLPISELFWSESRKGTIRGLHWQAGVADGFKIVWVTFGEVRDVVLDLRPTSSTWLNWQAVDLSRDSGALFVPPGCAHGFEVVSERAVVNYAQEKAYSEQLERGILWKSIPAAWMNDEPTLSLRDSAHPLLKDHQDIQPFL